MTIKDLYKKYEIPPNLKLHQLRVAGVVDLIGKNWKNKKGVDINLDLLTKIALLHDMGNIVKFKIDVDSEHKFGLKNLEHWKSVQDRFIKRYGENAVEATGLICKEIGQEEVYEFVKKESEMYFNKPEELLKDKNWEIKIFYYADFRVKPQGVVSLDERLDDLVKRYDVSKEKLGPAKEVERQVQSKTTIDVKKIKEKDVEKLFEKLLSVKI